MRKTWLGLLGVLLLGIVGFYVLTSPTTYRLVRGQPLAAASATPVDAGAPNLENGRTLFYAGGCTSCHAVPNQDDKLKLGGGLALETPFGTFRVPNISPHKQDGIGAWRRLDFVRAMREGIAPGETHLYPAFPYPSYQRMSPGDLADMFAFILTLPPVAGQVPDHDLRFPFNIRRGMGLWDLAFLDGRVFSPDPSKSATWNRGAYLVNGPGHCAECHSERNLAGAVIGSRRFAGGPDPEGKGTVPNITPDPTGIGGWTQAELLTLLKTGETPNFDTVGGSMAAVIHNTSQLPDADRAAMAEYILSLAPLPAYKASK
ncbi:c-type cytochrome [Microvirga antarctica]|uniref:c-type cytochrome n=1 Tax=Microvirga antarctica TaxID=2819233 RepID=UPI001B311104|nr:cytochrome c [Microvirga antarctica]